MGERGRAVSGGVGLLGGDGMRGCRCAGAWPHGVDGRCWNGVTHGVDRRCVATWACLRRDGSKGMHDDAANEQGRRTSRRSAMRSWAFS